MRDGFAAVFELAEIGQLLLDAANLHFVEIAGGLFAIARDEGHRAAFVEKFDGGNQRLEGDAQRLRDMDENFRG